MSRRLVSLALGVLLVSAIDALLRAQAAPTAPAPAVSFAKDVEPILERSCLSCHGDAMQMSGALAPDEVATLKAWIDQGARWDAAVSFAKDIRPIFEGSCWTCHGDAAQLSKFDLRTRETALKGGARGSDIVPGDAERSR